VQQNQWTKSSKCAADQPSCVEVKAVRSGSFDGVMVRSPDAADGVLYYSRDEWTTFLAGVRAGDFDI